MPAQECVLLIPVKPYPYVIFSIFFVLISLLIGQD